MSQPKRVLLTHDGELYYVKDASKDFHMEYGAVSKEDLAKEEGLIKAKTGKELGIFQPFFIDTYMRIKRGAQIIPLKDIGVIIAETGIGPNTRVLDAGAGSGGLSLFLAHIAKEVISYEIRDDFMENVKANIELLNLKNLTLKKQDIYEGIPDSNFDVITLDVPEPWKVIEHASKAVKPGGFVVAYCPSLPQTQDFVNAIHEHPSFVHIKTMELIEREWEVKGRKVRPKTAAIGHSGMLSFIRRIQ